MLNPFRKKKTIVENVNDFSQEYQVSTFIATKYLWVWFWQIFQEEPYRSTFSDQPYFYKTLGVQVLNYLMGRDIEDISDQVKPEVKEQLQQTIQHVPKWADDCMSQDKDFCELVVTTLRLKLIYSQFQHGRDFVHTSEGERITGLLMKYGRSISKEPSPEGYTKLLRKWMIWDEEVTRKFGEDFFTS